MGFTRQYLLQTSPSLPLQLDVLALWGIIQPELLNVTVTMSTSEGI